MKLYLIIIFQCIFITSHYARPVEKPGRLNNGDPVDFKEFSNVSKFRHTGLLEGESVYIFGNGTLTYEFIWIHNEKSAINFKIGYGYYYRKQTSNYESEVGEIYKISLGLFLNNGFEINAGLAGIFDVSNETYPGHLWPVLSIGKRYHFDFFILRFYLSTFGVGLAVGIILH